MRSNTPVTLTHHTTPPPYYCHTHSVHTSIPNAQVSRAGLLVWYGGAAAIRGGQAGGGSHSAGCAVHPTSTPVQPTSITTSSYRFSHPIKEVRACPAPVKSRSNSKSRIKTRMAGLLDSNRHYLFQLRTETPAARTSSSAFYLPLQLHVEKSSPPPLPRFQRTCTRTLCIYRYHYRYRH